MAALDPPPLPTDAALEASSLDALLPIIRIVRARGNTALDADQEVLAIYEDRLVAFRSAGKAKVPSEAYEPGGHARLTALPRRGALAELEWEDITTGWIGEPILAGRRWLACRELGHPVRVQTTNGFLEVFLPEEDARAVSIALRRLLRMRLVERAILTPLPREAPSLIAPPRSRALRAVAIVTAFSVCWLAASGVLLSIGMMVEATNERFFELIFGLLAIGTLGLQVGWLWPLLMVNAVLQVKRSQRRTRIENEHLARRRPRRRGRRPRRRTFLFSAVGLALKVIGAGTFLAFCVLEVVAEIDGFTLRRWPEKGYILATFLIYYGYRLSLRPAEDVRRQDSRPPILYLRSFELDGRHNFNPRDWVAQTLGIEPIRTSRWLGPIGSANPVRLIRLLGSRSADHVEEQLAGYFQRDGPFVAIGEPGERLALGGAARYYVGDDAWQETVQRLMQESAMVVLQPGDSDSMWWEIRETIDHTGTGNLLFLLLDCKGSQARYERFRLRFERDIDTPLPRHLGANVFLCFTAAGPLLLPLRQRPHVLWPVTGCAIDFAKTLAPFFASRRGTTEPISAAPGRLQRCCSAALGMAVWIVALIGGLLAADYAVRRILFGTEARRFARAAETGGDRMQIEGPVDMPYRLGIPRLWAETRVTPEFTEGFAGKPVQFWQLGRVGWVMVSGGQQPAGATQSSRDLTDAAVEGFRTRMQEVGVLGERTEVREGREWLITHLRMVESGESAKIVRQRGAPFQADAVLESTLRVYAGPDGWMEFQSAQLQPAASVLAPACEKVFAGLTVPPPTEIERRHAEIQATLTPRREAGTAATFTGGEGEHRYRLALKPEWRPGTAGVFHLGAANFKVILLPAAQKEADAQRDLMTRFGKEYGPVTNLSERTISTDGRNWTESSYDGQVDGSPVAIFQRLHACNYGRIVLFATAPQASRSEYETAVRAAFASFTLSASPR